MQIERSNHEREFCEKLSESKIPIALSVTIDQSFNPLGSSQDRYSFEKRTMQTDN